MVISENLDPAELPDAETGFSDTVLGIDLQSCIMENSGDFPQLQELATPASLLMAPLQDSLLMYELQEHMPTMMLRLSSWE